MGTIKIALTTNETQTTIVDKKTMKKRVKYFLKKQKSARGTPMKTESKLSKIQKSMMEKHMMKRLKDSWPCVNVEGGDPELTVRFIF
jgi:hypothetical protein